ncbi:MAG: putative cruciform DNA binding protein [Piptocephalis tieghemiana]|nr:MAG: putative cruciform DNA binding protein [Piptocephalis tieghemiana]
MAGEPSKLNANMTWAKGQVQSTLGGIINNERMRSQGEADISRGNAEYEAAKAKGYAGGALDKASGTVKDTANQAMGDNAGQAEGKIQKAKGDTRMDMNS